MEILSSDGNRKQSHGRMKSDYAVTVECGDERKSSCWAAIRFLSRRMPDGLVLSLNNYFFSHTLCMGFFTVIFA